MKAVKLPLEKEEKYMETKKATITRKEDSALLVLENLSINQTIILTEDNPNNVKDVFNNLLKDLKKGVFEFELQDGTEDMYHAICTEYLIQLNSELAIIFQEMEEYELTENSEYGGDLEEDFPDDFDDDDDDEFDI
ncbi:hypothetical protein [Flavobacterium sp.]|uniref:hypothetical protein n=1 Tax=Flavobacterium sp. TaxID=239 RepID=UPI0031D3DA62